MTKVSDCSKKTGIWESETKSSTGSTHYYHCEPGETFTYLVKFLHV